MSKEKQKGYRNEKAVAEYFGGERRGTLGAEDVNHPTMSIETKHYGHNLLPKFILKVYEQAERNSPAGKIPVAILHQVNDSHKDDFCIIKAKHLKELLDACIPF